MCPSKIVEDSTLIFTFPLSSIPLTSYLITLPFAVNPPRPFLPTPLQVPTCIVRSSLFTEINWCEWEQNVDCHTYCTSCAIQLRMIYFRCWPIQFGPSPLWQVPSWPFSPLWKAFLSSPGLAGLPLPAAKLLISKFLFSLFIHFEF